jgi:hypothetical protein
MSVLFIPDLISSDIVLYFETLFKVDVVTSSFILLLPLAFSIGQWILFVVLILGIGNFKKIFSREFFLSISQSFAGAGVFALASYVSLQLLSGVFDLDTFVGIAAQGIISGLAGVASGFIFLIIIGNKEVSVVFHTSLKKIRGQALPHPEVKEEL